MAKKRKFEEKPRREQFVLRGAQLEAYLSRDREVLLSGPAGCVGGETLVRDPATGHDTPVIDLYRRGEPLTVQTLDGPAMATAPFRKGVLPLFRLTTVSGRSCAVTLHHRMLTRSGWRMVHEIGPGDEVAADGGAWDAVADVGYLRTDEYFDLHVPGAEHYLADGLYHHNTGKAQPLHATVMCPSGPRRMGDLAVGDEVLTPAGGVARVAMIHPQGVRPIWRMRLSTGVPVECTEDHLWYAYRPGQRPSRATVVPLREMMPDPAAWRVTPSADVGEGGTHDVVAIEPAGEAECRCVTLDDFEGMYLTDGWVPTHNSVACLAKLHDLCGLRDYPGVRVLIVRKTRESLTESALATFEQLVVPPGHPAIASGGQRRMRQSYRYPNGSEIVIGGMDKPSKILSTEFDICYIQEAIELREEDWGTLITRIGRRNTLPFQQIIADTNPGAPTHWLKKRCDGGHCRILYARHEDNPAFHDGTRFTPAGLRYRENLSTLPGMLRERMLDGKWVQAEGVVYDGFDPAVHMINPSELPGGGPYPPPDWPRYWSVDFGYTAPFVWQAWAADHDGRLYMYREIYRTGVLVTDHAERIMHLWREEADHWRRLRNVPLQNAMRQISPRVVVCDYEDAEGRATLERSLGLATCGARKYVRQGVQAVALRLRPAGDGRPRLFLVAGAVDGRDRTLREAKRPECTAEEFPLYLWDAAKDVPQKQMDHGMDAMRYLVMQMDTGIAGVWEAAGYVEAPEPSGPSGVYSAPEQVETPRLRFGGGANGRNRRLFGA